MPYPTLPYPTFSDSDDVSSASDIGAFDLRADDSDDISDSDEEDSDEQADDPGTGTQGWGSRKAAYYHADTADAAEDTDEEQALASEEEREVKRLTAAKSAGMQAADFGLGEWDEASSGDSSSSDTPSDGEDQHGVLGADQVEDTDDAAGVADSTQKLQAVLSDAPELLGVLKEFSTRTQELRNTLTPVLMEIKRLQREGNDQPGGITRGGVQYLEVRHQLLLTYLVLLGFYLLQKAMGGSVAGHPVIEQLIRVRTLLEKASALHGRVKFRIDRLLRAAKTGEDGSADAGPLRPNPAALAAHDEDLASEDESDDSQAEGAYKPLRRTAVHYDDVDGAGAAKLEREQARRAARLKSSRMLAELREEMSEQPTELASADLGSGAVSGKSALDRRLEALAAERQAFEEDYFVRLNVSKKEKKLRKRRERERARLAALGDLEDFSALQDTAEAMAAAVPLKSSAKARSAARAGGDGFSAAPSNFATFMEELGEPGAGRKRRRGALQPAEEDSDLKDSRTRRARAAAQAGLGYDVAEAEAMYQDATADLQARRQARSDAAADRHAAAVAMAAAAGSDDEISGNQHRNASQSILKNKGLTRYRDPKRKNPRVANRLKAARRDKARSGQVQKLRVGEGAKYGGEASGISAHVSRSRVL